VFTPEFVVEVRSPAQRGAGLRELQEKMAEYTDNGVELAWLIDPEEQTVTIYRPGRAAEVLRAPAAVAGGGSVSGFVLEMDGVLG
jgi:Uma2 family endonuclease